MKWWGVFLLSTISITAFGQELPIGLREGLLGNSGVALTTSTAASYYNPSLLRDREDNSYSIGGSSFSSMKLESSGTHTSSTNISPSYVSSILVGDSLVHEFFYLTLASGTLWSESQNTSTSYTNAMNIGISRFGYSMAFRSIPFAMQFLGRYTDASLIGYGEGQSPNMTFHQQADVKDLAVALGLSGHARFKSYSLGFNFITRGLKIYKAEKGFTRIFVQGSPNPNDYIITEKSSAPLSISEERQSLKIGHSFANNGHEFVTDSFLVETPEAENTYNFYQSFGYMLTSQNGHQLMTGVRHALGPEIKYFGQDIYASVGYSWKTRGLRSSFGVFYNQKDLNTQYSVVGLNFASEFSY
ncbi:MAG: hypothetical protein AAGB31_08025 [Bdellovibrio sp.]